MVQSGILPYSIQATRRIRGHIWIRIGPVYSRIRSVTVQIRLRTSLPQYRYYTREESVGRMTLCEENEVGGWRRGPTIRVGGLKVKAIKVSSKQGNTAR